LSDLINGKQLSRRRVRSRCRVFHQLVTMECAGVMASMMHVVICSRSGRTHWVHGVMIHWKQPMRMRRGSHAADSIATHALILVDTD
jgi:hypothetical protein